jgi:ATP-dependent Clp protease, protease subunit
MFKLTKKILGKIGKKTKKSKEKESAEEAEKEEKSGAATLVELLAGKDVDVPEDRSIMFVGEVTEDKAAELISALLVLAQTKEEDQDRADDIKMYVNTYGGSADEMFAIYDAMNWCKQFCDIQTIGFGKVMSAGTLLLAAGTDGKRHISPHCRVMIHSVNGGHVGELHNLQNEMEQMAALQDDYIQALSSETKMTKKQIQSLINKKINVYLNAEETIEKGLADEVWDGR